MKGMAVLFISMAYCSECAAQKLQQQQPDTLGDWRPLWERQLPQEWQERNRVLLNQKAREREQEYQRQRRENEAQRPLADRPPTDPVPHPPRQTH